MDGFSRSSSFYRISWPAFRLEAFPRGPCSPPEKCFFQRFSQQFPVSLSPLRTVPFLPPCLLASLPRTQRAVNSLLSPLRTVPLPPCGNAPGRSARSPSRCSSCPRPGSSPAGRPASAASWRGSWRRSPRCERFDRSLQSLPTVAS